MFIFYLSLYALIGAYVRADHDVILISTENRQQDVTELDLGDPVNKHIVLQHRKSLGGITYDPVDQRMYWAEPGARAILSAKLDGSQQKTLLDNVDAYGLTVNVHGREIIFTGSNTVSRISLNSRHVTSIIPNASGAIDVEYDPLDKYVYWSNFLKNHIVKCTYTASHCETLVNTTYPLNIALDSEGKRLFWVTGDHEKVRSVDLNGHDERTELSSNDDMYTALDFYNGNLYVAAHNSRQGKIYKYNVKSRQMSTVSTEENKAYYDIAVSPKHVTGSIIG